MHGDVAKHRAELDKLVAHPALVDVEPSLQTDKEATALAAHLRQAIPQTAGGVDNGGPPAAPVHIWLAAGQTALAQRLYAAYGDRVKIRFGSLTYPINRARFRTTQRYYPQDLNSGPAPLTGPCGYTSPKAVAVGGRADDGGAGRRADRTWARRACGHVDGDQPQRP